MIEHVSELMSLISNSDKEGEEVEIINAQATACGAEQDIVMVDDSTITKNNKRILVMKINNLLNFISSFYLKIEESNSLETTSNGYLITRLEDLDINEQHTEAVEFLKNVITKTKNDETAVAKVHDLIKKVESFENDFKEDNFGSTKARQKEDDHSGQKDDSIEFLNEFISPNIENEPLDSKVEKLLRYLKGFQIKMENHSVENGASGIGEKTQSTFEPIKGRMMKIGTVNVDRYPIKITTDDSREVERNTHKQLNLKSFPCKDCKKEYKKKQKLYHHIKSVHDKVKDWGCHYCEHTTSQKQFLERHINAVHGQKKIQCATCKELFATKTVWKQHLKRKHHAKERQIPLKLYPQRNLLPTSSMLTTLMMNKSNKCKNMMMNTIKTF